MCSVASKDDETTKKTAMHLHKVEIENFRLLAKVELIFEGDATVIVGRNNSGKTSLTELFRRLLSDSPPSFRFEDFSLSAHEQFWDVFKSKDKKTEIDLRNSLPQLAVKFTIAYEKETLDLGALSNCIIDLEADCTDAVIQFRYSLRQAETTAFFAELMFDPNKDEIQQKTAFCRSIRDRVSKMFSCEVRAIDPIDPANTKLLEWSEFNAIIGHGFINAQRGLDDVTNKDRDVLGKVLESLLRSARSDVANIQDKAIVGELELAVKGIQTSLDTGFNKGLQELLPAFSLFGYPGFADPSLCTETILDVERLLTNHTKVHYAGVNGINLPEAYNGLGARNLIYMLLRLLEFYKAFLVQKTQQPLYLVFIEEPEVHLHPQMQEVFIAQLSRIANEFSKTIGGGRKWPVQFVVTTHSSHMANRADFSTMRYFLVRGDGSAGKPRATVIKDLRRGIGSKVKKNLEFLHQYMTLTRCDLLFADKAILIEGTSERLLLPKMVEKCEDLDKDMPRLSRQFISIVEVGGAYAHLFFPLMEFLEIPTLVITDIDATLKNAKGKYEACLVSEGERTSNACINDWFSVDKIAPRELLTKSNEDKLDGNLRIAFEIPEKPGLPCGRSFEEAFILANPNLFDITTLSEKEASDKADEQDKTDFALEFAIYKTNWIVPRYISEGLLWLAKINQPSKLVAPALEVGKQDIKLT